MKKKTGGGPNKTKHLNSYEESVVRSAGLNAAVAGIPATKSYGCRKRQLHTENALSEPLSQRDTENSVFVEEYNEDYLEEELNSEPMESGERTDELGIAARFGAGVSKRTNPKKEKLELLRRYVEAKEKSNETQKTLLQVKKESLKIKRQLLELKLNKYASTGANSQCYDETDSM